MERYRQKWLALAGISILAFTAFFDFTIVNTALPFIQKHFDANILSLQWVANILAIVLSMSMIAMGKLGDLWGRKKVFYFGVVIFGVAALGAGLSPTIEWLIFFRGLQGLGISVLFVIGAALVSDAFPKEEQPKAVGFYSGITGVGLTIGPFLGGMLLSVGDWRWVFWINIPLVIGGALFCFYGLRHVTPSRHRAKIDWISLLLLTIGLGVLVYGIVEVNWISLVGLIALAALFLLDLRKEEPLLRVKEIVRDKMVLFALLSCCMGAIASYTFLFFDPLYLENVRHLTAFKIGLIIAVIPVAQVLISFSFEFLVKKLGMANLFLISVMSATAAVCLHLTIGARTPYLWMVVPFFLLGIPWGLSNAGMVTTVNQRVPEHKVGEVIGTMTTAWNVTGAIFLSISSVIFHLSNVSFIHGFRSMTMVNLAFTVLVLFASLWIRKQLRKS